MKKLLTLVLLFSCAGLMAQTYQPAPQSQVSRASSGPAVRLHGYTTYAFDDNHVDSYYSNTSYFEGSFEGGFQWGGGLEVMPAPSMGVEFTYLRLDSKAPMEYYNGGVEFTNFDIATNWLMLGGNKYVPNSSKVEPYGGFMLGMAIFDVTNPDNNNSSSSTKFAWGAKLGANIWANEKVGIKLQMNLLSAVQAVGGGLYFGTGGAGAGVSGFSTFYQFSLGGGLVFRLK